MQGSTAKSAALNRLELTGRARSHVAEQPDLGVTMHPAAAAALRRMAHAAAAEHIQLKVVSAFRSFEQQLAIWNAKFAGLRPMLDRACRPVDSASLNESGRVATILLWSALPGASRHHWGTDLDLVDGQRLAAGQKLELLPAAYAAGGQFEKLAAWLHRHATHYGFFWPYDRDRGGVQPEPWHLSYAPVAAPAVTELGVEELRLALADAEIAGKDCILATLPEIHQRYVRAVAAAPRAWS